MGRNVGNCLIGIRGHGMITGERPIWILNIKKGDTNTMHVISKVRTKMILRTNYLWYFSVRALKACFHTLFFKEKNSFLLRLHSNSHLLV